MRNQVQNSKSDEVWEVTKTLDNISMYGERRENSIYNSLSCLVIPSFFSYFFF